MKKTRILPHLISWTILPASVPAAPSHQEATPRIPARQDTRVAQRRQTPYLATNPVPQYIPQALTVATTRAAECKNCPWGSCLNALAVTSGADLGIACWTQGEAVNNERMWVRHTYGARLGDFCYVSLYDMQQQSSDFYRSRLPYCGNRSELNFFLPRAATKTELFTECSLCPYRDCEGVEFYQAGVGLDVNCVVTDGWMQVSPTHEMGTKKYYRTFDNCYVSAASVKEVALQPDKSEQIPACGPVPHLRLQDRPPAPPRTESPSSAPSSSSASSPKETQAAAAAAGAPKAGSLPRMESDEEEDSDEGEDYDYW